MAPSIGLPDAVREALYADAVRITQGAGYVNAGTVEFLVDPKSWEYYFLEVNPRIQVEHTVTEVPPATLNPPVGAAAGAG
eukprot:993984-Prymnesium_polylepis.1